MRWLLKRLNVKLLPKPDTSTICDAWCGWHHNVPKVR